jgi:parallel beta-helix repeat protein
MNAIVATSGYHETCLRRQARDRPRDDPNDPAVAATIIDGGTEAVTFSGGEDANSILAGFTVTGAVRGIYCQSAAPTIRNCRIVGNAEAGLKLWGKADPRIVNCIIAGNGGDGIEMWADRTGRIVAFNLGTIAHCTIVGNRAHGLRGGKPIVVSTIVYFNAIDGTSTQISADAPVVEYCDVQGGFAGTGNLDADPRFVAPAYWSDPADPNQPAAPGDPTAIWVGSDYHLSPDSPCIDVGDFGITPDLVVLLDIDGDLRPFGLRPDLGADEYAPKPAP